MKRRLGSVLVASILVLAAASIAAAADASPLRLKAAKGGTFPERLFVLTAPQRIGFDPDALVVLENGKPVHDLAVTPLRATRDTGTVLVIDASKSMGGEAIDAAMKAARLFARHRKPAHKLGAVAYNAETSVLLPFTTDGATVAEALAKPPPVAYWTRMYEAVTDAVALTREEQLRSATIVLLSDGQELGSRSTLSAAIEAARSARVRIFSVALMSRFFDSTTLRALAERTGGEYFEAASPEALVRIYDKLGYELANEYLVEYRSLAGPTERVTVSAQLTGVKGIAKATYTSPKLVVPEVPPGAIYQPTALDRFLRSPLTMLGLAALAALFVALLVVGSVRPRGEALSSRLSRFVSLTHAADARRETGLLTERVLAGTDRSLRKWEWWPRFKEALDVAEIRMPAEQIVVLTVIGTAFSLWILGLLTQFPWPLAAFAVPAAVWFVLKRKIVGRFRAFEEQLPDNLEVFASALRAGHSLVGAMSVVADDAAEPSRREFKRVLHYEQLGVPLDESLVAARKRLRNRDLEQVALVTALQRETGGDSAEVLDRVTENVRTRAELRRLVQVLTAQGRLARWILTGLPVAMFLLIYVQHPEYMAPLFDTRIGNVLLAGGIVLVVAGSYAIKKIVDIKI